MLPTQAALILAHVILVADGVPRLDVEATCRAAHPLTAEEKAPYRNCVDDQKRAHTTLEAQWEKFPTAARARCVRESTLGGSPSYVELLTCLELARDTQIDAGTPPEPVAPGRTPNPAPSR